MAEARGLHVVQSRLVERALACGRSVVIWDVGLGAAANAIAVLEAFAEAPCPGGVELHSFDSTSAPLEFAAKHAAELGYLSAWTREVDELLAHGRVTAGNVRWHFHRVDFREFVRAPEIDRPDAILYDPYSPAANPGMWTFEHFTRLRACLDPARPCTLTNYSRSTAVRVTLALAGFFVGRGGATGEKEETTIAATHRELLLQPLGAEWVKMVGRSTRGSPLREAGQGGRIWPEDLAALERLLNEPVPRD
jgi:tRNA U34 5-methylaminomethyl-2-thiouridine-forming methyltransferase MnmC